MKTYWGSGGIALLILDLGTRVNNETQNSIMSSREIFKCLLRGHKINKITSK